MIEMTDRIGDLSGAQVLHLATGLEHAHDMTLRDAGGGRYWLERLEDGGAILIKPDRTVEQVWKFAESVLAAEATAVEEKFRWVHRPGEPLCDCDFPQIWLGYPHECNRCMRLLPNNPTENSL